MRLPWRPFTSQTQTEIMPQIPVFDITQVENLDAAEPSERAQKLWSMVFLLAVKDMATVIRYEPHRGQRSLAYQVDGVYHTMVPPPKQVANELIDELLRLLVLGQGESPGGWLDRWLPWRQQVRVALPLKSLLELRLGDKTVDAIVTVQSNDFGRSAVIYLVDATPEYGPRSEASDKAVQVFRRMFAAKHKERGDEFSRS